MSVVQQVKEKQYVLCAAAKICLFLAVCHLSVLLTQRKSARIIIIIILSFSRHLFDITHIIHVAVWYFNMLT